MKAERRHELQTNSLSLWIRWRAPELAQKYGTVILLGVIALALAIVLIRWRIQAPKLAAQKATDKLSVARGFITELKNGQVRPGDAAQATKLINDAMEESDTPVVRAQGFLSLGDYYWALANWPDIPGAETQPSLRPEMPHDALLSSAEDAYSKVLQVQNAPAYLIASAHLGLGTVQEQRAFELERAGKPGSDKLWSAAKEQYEAVVKTAGVLPVLKDEAAWHIERLASLQEPIWLVPPPPASQPTTQAAAGLAKPLAAAPQPTTRPAVGVSPTTRPAP